MPPPGSRALRPPLAITVGVWRALFLREATARLARSRWAGILMVLEPVAHIALLLALFQIGFRQRLIAGGDTTLFVMAGVLGFFLPRNLFVQGTVALGRSGALYAFRNVMPVDAVLARIGLESLLSSVVFLIICGGAAFLGMAVAPADPLAALQALGTLWLLGLGLALALSVPVSLAGLNQVPRFILTPLYIFSAVMYPSILVPHGMREVLLLNPLVHGVESLRLAFMPAYQVPAGIELAYPLQCAVVLIFLGLALHVRYQDALSAA